jgi:hypothetical protein
VLRPSTLIRLASVVLTLAVAATHAAAVAEAQHLVCVAAHHGCGTALVISPCCCGGQSQSSRAAGPIQSTARISTPPASAVIIVTTVAPQPLVLNRGRSGRTSPVASSDIPILLANLRL